jgi:hypothetical protein
LWQPASLGSSLLAPCGSRVKIETVCSTETLLATVHSQKCGKKKHAPLLVLICAPNVVWQLEKFSIIQVQDCICNVVQNRRIVILLNVEVSSPFCTVGLSLDLFISFPCKS